MKIAVMFSIIGSTDEQIDDFEKHCKKEGIAILETSMTEWTFDYVIEIDFSKQALLLPCEAIISKRGLSDG